MDNESRIIAFKSTREGLERHLGTCEKLFYSWATRVCNLWDSIHSTQDEISYRRKVLQQCLSLQRKEWLDGAKSRGVILTCMNNISRKKERNQKRKEQGYFKSIKDMTSREQRKTRRSWRINSAGYRKRHKEVENILTPPNSPNPQELLTENRRATTMKRRATQKKQKEKAKCYRENERLKVKLKFQERLTNKYKKRCERMKKKLASMKTCVSGSKSKPDSNFTTKTYVLYTYLTGCRAIRQCYKKSKTNKQKRVISGLILREQILKKYGLSTLARQILGISRSHMKRKRPKRPRLQSVRIKENVKTFFERDDVSKIKADKQATITRKGIKKQIRLLTDDLKMLHEKYLSEGNNISYSLFCKLRPFWTIKR